MSYRITFSKQASGDIELFKKSETAAYKKVMRLLPELELHPRTGTGKPKPLSGNMAGQWSRRITDKHRLVYAIDDDKIIVLVLTAAGHYDD
ncbi:toxin YoeB [Bacteroidia bacterium]|nr:toxin YoeB [Bacteroidia bacterium]